MLLIKGSFLDSAADLLHTKRDRDGGHLGARTSLLNLFEECTSKLRACLIVLLEDLFAISVRFLTRLASGNTV